LQFLPRLPTIPYLSRLLTNMSLIIHKHWRTWLLLGMALIFAADTLSPYEIAAAVFYSLIILAAASRLKRTTLLWLAASCALLTLLSLPISHLGGAFLSGLINTLISLSAIGATTYLALKRNAATAATQKAEAQLLRLARIQTLEGLTTTLAHELSQPLTVMISSAEAAQRWLVQQPAQTQRTLEALQRIVGAGGQASSIVGRVRSLTQQATPERSVFDLNAAAGEVLALADAQITAGNIRLISQWAADLPPVFADRVQVQQVISNLLLNAIEAMSGQDEALPRRLQVISQQQPHQAELIVIDSGPGFAAVPAEQLFAAFWTTKAQGLGLGLGICRMIIESQDGQISAQNLASGGACFSFTLPLAKEESHASRDLLN